MQLLDGKEGMRLAVLFVGVTCIFLLGLSAVHGDVVINEIHYNPPDPDDGDTPGSLREFLELYNPGPENVDLSGYEFTKGISYTFSEGQQLAAGEYLILARVPTYSGWNNVAATIMGPYEGALSNSGERLKLVRPDGTEVDDLRYSDELPWPRAADGYGSSLERIAWDLPADDYHSWRASSEYDGSPGRENSVVGTPSRPVILSYSVEPENPTSEDEVTVRLALDSPQIIENAILRWEIAGDTRNTTTFLPRQSTWRFWPGTSAPSQGTEWTALEFDDSSWSTGIGGFGYGDTSTVDTVVNDMRGNYTTFYIRQHFTIEDPAALHTLVLSITVDDGFVAYLNGTEIARAYAPDVVEHTSTALESHESTSSLPNFIIRNADQILRPGENVLAVAGLNYDLTSTDFVLSPSIIEFTNTQKMTLVEETDDTAIFEAAIPAHPSQSLIRYNVRVDLANGESVTLPHANEPRPFESYFVYDGELVSPLPMLWIFDRITCTILDSSKIVGGAVALMPGEDYPQVFDGAALTSARNGTKLKFLKDEKFRGDRTLNIIPERPTSGSTAGTTSPHREHFAFWFFQEMNVPTPRCEWFRIFERVRNPPEGSRAYRQTQNVVVQQINESFLALLGRNPESDIYKLEYDSGFTKKTNLEEGYGTLNELQSALAIDDPVARRAEMERLVNLDEMRAYSVACLLTSNWDGFHNNNWMIYDPEKYPGWEIVPWDLDKAWGFTDGDPMFVEMIVDFPIDGRSIPSSFGGRRPGPITGRVHLDTEFHEEYVSQARIALDTRFTDEFLYTKLDEIEATLLEDLELMEQQTGLTQTRRYQQIIESDETIKTFIALRRQYLNNALPVPVEEWMLH